MIYLTLLLVLSFVFGQTLTLHYKQKIVKLLNQNRLLKLEIIKLRNKK
jgi:hypothetical protein